MKIASINGLNQCYAKNFATKKEYPSFKGSSLGGGVAAKVLTEGAAVAEASAGSLFGGIFSVLGAAFAVAKFQQDNLKEHGGNDAAYEYAMDRIMMDITYG